ncbi:MAG TPA: YceI family protein [Actinophytocola sp.]|jgi:polyisoprenoid-binding protein YceI|uniref:YceI family protein n=1 Tax=Actinophytocola sp. TaxID=1872138 RepID=UPI002F921C0F
MTSTTTDTVAIPATGEYRVDPDRSTISFATRHLFGLAPVRGTFRLRDGHIRVAGDPAGSAARAVVAADSFHTGSNARDTEVRSAHYLDVDRHPDIVFASTDLERTEGGWVLHGTLTVRGRTNPVPVRILSLATAGQGVRLRARARVDRYAFGITAGRGLAGRRLTLTLDVVAG